jgi:hypothetical protein
MAAAKLQLLLIPVPIPAALPDLDLPGLALT